MGWDKTKTNFLLVALNIITLTFFITPTPNILLIPFVILSSNNFFDISVKYKLYIVSSFSIICALISNQFLEDIMAIISLGIAVNVMYTIDSSLNYLVLQIGFAVSTLMGYLLSNLLLKSSVGKDIILITFTLPNLFFAVNSPSKQRQPLYIVSPIIDSNQNYCLGFLSGSLWNFLYKIPRHNKILMAFILVAIQIILQSSFLTPILNFGRGFLIYSEQSTSQQRVFLYGFILLKLFLPTYLNIYMSVGYLLIAGIVWKASILKLSNQKKDIQMNLIDKGEINQQQNDKLRI